MKKFSLFTYTLASLLLSSSLCAFTANKLGYQYLQDKNSLPKISERQEEKLILNNGLRVYLIHDPNVSQSTLSFSVGSGMLDDGLEYPGLSRVVEKGLFNSSKKYPAGLYHYMDQAGAKLWSQSYLDRTVYTISVGEAPFSKLVDQVAAAIKHPNFSQEIIEAAKQKLHRDYQYFSKLENWPLELIKQKLARPSHPYAYYFPGNNKTLEGLSTKQVGEWYYKHYTPRNMRLIVLSPLNLEEQKESLLTSFYAFEGKEKPRQESHGPLFSKKQLGKKIKVYQPHLKQEQVILSWELDSSYLKEAPGYHKILQRLFSADTEGALAPLLKKEGLITSLNTQLIKVGRENLLFEIQAFINPHHAGASEKLVSRCFQAIESFKKNPLPDYIPKEISQLEWLQASYPKPLDASQEAFEKARMLLDEELASFPTKSTLKTAASYDSMNFLAFLNELSAEKSQIFYLFPEKNQQPLTLEPHTQSSYSVEALSPKELISYEKIIPLANVFPPKPNPFVSVQQHVQLQSNVFDIEKLLVDNEYGRLYHIALEGHKRPTVYWEFRIKSPLASAKDQVYLDLLSLSLKRETKSLHYLANEAGLEFHIHPYSEGLVIRLQGFSDKAPLLLQELSYQLRSQRPSSKYFEKDKTQLFSQYRLLEDKAPLKQGENILSSFIYKGFTTEKEKAQLIGDLKHIDYQNFVTSFFDKTYVEGVLMGNMSFDEAKTLSTGFIKQLSQQPYLPKEQQVPHILVLNPQQGPFSYSQSLKHHDNGLMLLLGHGSYEPQKFVTLQLLNNLINQELKKDKKFPKSLSLLKNIEGQVFTLISLESPSLSSKDLLDYTESFLDQFLQRVPHILNEENFAKQKKLVERQINPSFSKLSDKGLFISLTLYEAKKSFASLEKEKESLHFLNPEILIRESKQLIGKTNKKRLALMLEGILPKETAAYYKLIEDKKQVLLFNRFIKGRTST